MSLFAFALLLAAAQPAPEAPPARPVEETVVEETVVEEAAPAEEPAPAPVETAAVTTTATDAPEVEVEEDSGDDPTICRRRSVDNGFGKMSTRKVCKPKSVWEAQRRR